VNNKDEMLFAVLAVNNGENAAYIIFIHLKEYFLLNKIVEM